MAAAALTPRVRMMAICDDATPSDIETGVYTLEGVRQGIVADALPCPRHLYVFLVLSCPRAGAYDGWVQVMDSEREKVLRMEDFNAVFDGTRTPVSVDVRVANCVFPIAGEYTFEVWIRTSVGDGVLKGEQALRVNEE